MNPRLITPARKGGEIFWSVAGAPANVDKGVTRIHGTARVWDKRDRNRNNILAGACGTKPFEVPLLAYHDDEQGLGEALMTPTAIGLDYEAEFAQGIPRVDETRELIRAGAIPAVSIGWVDDAGTSTWDANYEEHTFPDATVVELSVVPVPAQPEVTLFAAGFDPGKRMSSADLIDIYAAVGKRNNANDAKRIQSIHDAACQLGAMCTADDNGDGGDEDDNSQASAKTLLLSQADRDVLMLTLRLFESQLAAIEI